MPTNKELAAQRGHVENLARILDGIGQAKPITVEEAFDLVQMLRGQGTKAAELLRASVAALPRICSDCFGNGEKCLAGCSAHPSNWYKCETCGGNGTVAAEASK